jgi:NAD(P)-dependent dehydrogenase (short-subunit alcohol dehydrogenase family)
MFAVDGVMEFPFAPPNEGVTVNVFAPGLTLTPALAKSMPPEMIEAQVRARPIQRDEKGEDLVGSVFFLASPDTHFMSGQPLNVDGGSVGRASLYEPVPTFR